MIFKCFFITCISISCICLLLINLRLNKNGEDKREVIQVDKTKLIGLFSQIEKLQEQLDKLS